MSDWYDIRGNSMGRDASSWSDRSEGSDWQRAHRNTEVNGDSSVSTVWLSLDHSYGDGPPLIFETMVFGGNLDQTCERYSTMEQAHAGHDSVVQSVRDEAAAFADIAAASDVRAAVLLLEQTFATHREQFDMGDCGDLYAPLVKAVTA